MKPENDAKERADLEREQQEILARVDATPILDVRTADEIIGYDEDGVPE